MKFGVELLWVGLAVLLVGCSRAPEVTEDHLEVDCPPEICEAAPSESVIETPSASKQETKSRFPDPDGPRIRLAFVGDVMMHRRIQQQAYWNKQGFFSAFSEMAEKFEHYDLVYANLESPTALGINAELLEVEDPGPRFDEHVYTGFPRFNAPSTILDALQEAGVDIVSTANNHAMDRGSLGIDRTIDALESYQMLFTGTRRAVGRSADFFRIAEVGPFKVGFLACTYGVGGPSDKHHQVSYCRHKESMVETIKRLSGEVDAVIVLPHWGPEYETTASAAQRDGALEFLEAGALAVVAAHPHVVQELEYVEVSGRKVAVMHSLGNFIGNQRQLERRTSVVLEIEVGRCLQEICITDIAARPIHTVIESRVLKVVPLHKTEDFADEWAYLEDRVGDFLVSWD